jgi:hypothetical protein
MKGAQLPLYHVREVRRPVLMVEGLEVAKKRGEKGIGSLGTSGTRGGKGGIFHRCHSPLMLVTGFREKVGLESAHSGATGERIHVDGEEHPRALTLPRRCRLAAAPERNFDVPVSGQAHFNFRVTLKLAGQRASKRECQIRLARSTWTDGAGIAPSMSRIDDQHARCPGSRRTGAGLRSGTLDTRGCRGAFGRGRTSLNGQEISLRVEGVLSGKEPGKELDQQLEWKEEILADPVWRVCELKELAIPGKVREVRKQAEIDTRPMEKSRLRPISTRLERPTL